jgi:acetyl esterase/lipase
VECIHDISGVIQFLTEKGIGEIILAGHSTGANKVAYYAAIQNDSRVKGIMLGSPVSDRYDRRLDKNTLKHDISMMEELINSGKGDGLVLGKMFFPLTPKRFISLVTPGPEDQMGYGEHPPELPFVSKITYPLLVILGEKDEYLDRSAREVLDVFKKLSNSTQYSEILLEDALHSYNGKEEIISKKILSWVASL